MSYLRPSFSKKILCISTCFILSLFPTLAQADLGIDFRIGIGMGLRYGVASAPLPLINISKTMGDSVIFTEAVLTPFLLAGSVGYSHELSQKTGFTVSKIYGGSIGPKFSGYKVGVTYNSNEFNKKGWEVALDYYAMTMKYNESSRAPDQPKRKNESKSTPSLSLGYHW